MKRSDYVMKITDYRLPYASRTCGRALAAAGCLMLLAAAGLLSGDTIPNQTTDSGHVPRQRLQWIDPLGRQPTSYKVWAKTHVAQDEVTHSGMILQSGYSNVVEVVVNAAIYPNLTSELTQYTSDLVAAGWSVRVDTMRGTRPQALRSLLQGIANIKGAVLVGELPIAWYYSDWGGGQPEEFPCDLYFADLDGTWTDSNNDGIFDGHTGNVAPEIWVGRLYTRPLTWDDEVRLLKHYFYKNHLYRTGGLSLPDSGLCFNDEDWAGSGDGGLTAIYPSVTVIEDGTTTAPNYRAQLVKGYEWIHVMAHSSAWGSTFKASDDVTYTGTVFNCEVYALQPHCHFYDLFCCSGARFTEENYSAGWMVFNNDWGLFAVGSTKTGSMEGWFNDYYTPISTGSCLGDGFKSWFIAHGESDRDWHYGLALIGDPTLKPRHGMDGDMTRIRPLIRDRVPGQKQPCGQVTKSSGGPSRADDPGPLTADIVSPNPETDADPVMIAAPDGKVWVVWVSGRSTTDGRFDMYAAYHNTNGWSAAMAIGTAEYWEYNPSLAIDNAGHPVCVWSVFEDSYHYTLHYSVWNGSSWSTSTQIADEASEDLQSTLTRDSTGRVWCFWQMRHGPWGDVWARYWNGSAWSSATQVTAGDTALHMYLSSAMDSAGRPWVFYTRYDQGRNEIWGDYYTGAAWVRNGPVSGTQQRALRPAAVRDAGGKLWVTWQSFDQGNSAVYACHLTGSSWSAPEPVSSIESLNVCPAIACDAAGQPCVVWQSKATGNWNIYASQHDAGYWTTPALVDSSSGFNLNPVITGSAGSTPWIAWQNYQAGGNWEIYAQNLPLSGISESPRTTPNAREPAPVLVIAGSPSRGSPVVCYSLSGRQVGRLALYDVMGCLVQDKGVVSGSGSLSFRGLPAGAYFVRLTSSAAPHRRRSSWLSSLSGDT